MSTTRRKTFQRIRSLSHSDRCCNPYDKKGHRGKDLRNVSATFRKSFPETPSFAKICSDCRKKRPSEISYSTSHEDVQMNDTSIIIPDSSESFTPSERQIELENMLQGLKDKFSSLSIHDPLRLRILTILPDAWSPKKISDEFKCNWNYAKKSKDLKSTGGVLAETTAKDGKKLTNNEKQKVHDIYEENSRIMAGINDVKSVKTDGGRVLMQRRLLLLDLRGLYSLYQEKVGQQAVSFSTFAQLRPQNCILAGGSGTHSVCVCTIHENVRLMLEAVNLPKITANSKHPMNTYKDCLQRITCSNATDKCFLGNCNKCPTLDNFKNNLHALLNDSNISEIQFSTWTGTDRSTLMKQVLNSDEFLEDLCVRLSALKLHSFIAKKQTSFYEEKKKNLKNGEILVVMDFSENYKFVVQNASQAFHFNNDQCTIFPIVCYYKEKSEIKHESLIFLSDCTKHDTAAVFTIQKQLVPYLVKKHRAKHLIYFTDGAKQHFKNRFQMANLVQHKTEFDITAEWHHHATAHGKGPSDGLGAVFKREAARYCLTCKPNDAILTCKRLFDWSKTKFSDKIITFYYTKQDHQKVVRHLNRRFENFAPPVPQISINHAFLVKEKLLIIKKYSDASENTELFYQ